ncbi:hypothetical protein EZS27_026608 [termite gut metagenome]|uniref:Uncharacterized protein n=1 Tax=termite gut metagenome TaxID=433724 RepID=A0A5J4QR51_9ZZZZ
MRRKESEGIRMWIEITNKNSIRLLRSRIKRVYREYCHAIYFTPAGVKVCERGALHYKLYILSLFLIIKKKYYKNIIYAIRTKDVRVDTHGDSK